MSILAFDLPFVTYRMARATIDFKIAAGLGTMFIMTTAAVERVVPHARLLGHAHSNLPVRHDLIDEMLRNVPNDGFMLAIDDDVGRNSGLHTACTAPFAAFNYGQVCVVVKKTFHRIQKLSVQSFVETLDAYPRGLEHKFCANGITMLLYWQLVLQLRVHFLQRPSFAFLQVQQGISLDLLKEVPGNVRNR